MNMCVFKKFFIILGMCLGMLGAIIALGFLIEAMPLVGAPILIIIVLVIVINAAIDECK